MQRIIGAMSLFALAACASAPAPAPTPVSSSMPAASSMASASMTFQATLSQGDEVPPPKLDAGVQPSGSATFTVSGTSIAYKVTATGLSSAYAAAHIHAGAAGVGGPVLAALTLTPGAPGTASGEGTIDAAAIKGKNADGSTMSMDDLLAALKGGSAYVNVHTVNNKAGEARGQITH